LLFFFLRKVDEKERTKFILTSLAALIFLLFDVFLSPNKDLDYLQRNSPYLDVKLIIEDSDLDGFHYYYLIKNIGQLPAENISFTFLSPMTKGSEIDPINKRL